jgi:hypothetical protein
MNPILKHYFERLESCAALDGLKYFIYKRDIDSSMPYSVHFQFIDKVGLVRNSWGSGKTQDEAFGKALMEMIERIYFSNYSPIYFKAMHGFFCKEISLFDLAANFGMPTRMLHPANTNGVSIHLTLVKAKQSALFELIERHTILYALLKRVSPHSAIKKDIALGKECSFFTWKSPRLTFTTVGAYFDGTGTYFSSGCDYNLNNSILKAELELNSFLFLEERKVTEYEIVKDDIQSFNRYHKFSGDRSALNFLESHNPGVIPDLDKSRFYYTKIPVPKIFDGLYPLPVIRVIHPDVQQLFFDNWKYEYLNPRLFSGDVSLPSFPHIIA